MIKSSKADFAVATLGQNDKEDGSKPFIILEGGTNRQRNKIIKSFQRIDLDVLEGAVGKGFLDSPPRERVRMLKALEGKTLSDIENPDKQNSKLIIKSLHEKR